MANSITMLAYFSGEMVCEMPLILGHGALRGGGHMNPLLEVQDLEVSFDTYATSESYGQY